MYSTLIWKEEILARNGAQLTDTVKSLLKKYSDYEKAGQRRKLVETEAEAANTEPEEEESLEVEPQKHKADRRRER